MVIDRDLRDVIWGWDPMGWSAHRTELETDYDSLLSDTAHEIESGKVDEEVARGLVSVLTREWNGFVGEDALKTERLLLPDAMTFVARMRRRL